MTGDRVTINEVGPRDGLQNLATFVDTDDKLRIIRSLLDSGIRSIEATSFVSPRWVPQLRDADALMAKLPQAGDVEYSVLVPNMKGYERAVAAGARSVAVVVSCTETMNRKNIAMSLDEAIAVSCDVIGRAAADGLRTRAYLAVAFECPFEGPTPLDVVIRLAGRLSDAGASEIAVADTIGAADPTSVHRCFSALMPDHGPARLSAHFHDTRGLGCANAFAALQAGVRKLDASIGGLGGCPFAPGAAGNLATEDLVHMLEAGGYSTGVDLDRLAAAVAVAESCVGQPLGGHWLRWRRSQERAGDAASPVQ